jgi:hypothetical protein
VCSAGDGVSCTGSGGWPPPIKTKAITPARGYTSSAGRVGFTYSRALLNVQSFELGSFLFQLTDIRVATGWQVRRGGLPNW